MRLDDKELKFMSGYYWKKRQQFSPFRIFKKWGLRHETNKDVLEIGCGSGRGAVLLSELNPKSYCGIDLMEEQIKLAKELKLNNSKFMKMDATDLRHFPDKSKDVIVIFTILHHIPKWRQVVKECNRVLRENGKIFIEEPNRRFITIWDKIFKWNHPKDALFNYKELEGCFENVGFKLVRRKLWYDFGKWYFQKY